MTFETVFLLVYAHGLLLVALGLHRLGRATTSPWAGRVLAGHRRRHPEAAAELVDPPGAWPHSEQLRVHTGIGLVAAAAAFVLGVVGLWRHHDEVETMLFSLTSVVALVVLRRLGRALAPGGGA